MNTLFGQAWLTTRAFIGGLLLLSTALVLVGICMFTARVFLHAPAGAQPGYYQWERGLIISGFLLLALGLAGLSSLLRQAGDPLLADLGLTAYVIGTVLLTLAEAAGLTRAGLPETLIGALVRIFVVLSLVGLAAFGAAMLQAGLLPAWLGWTTIIWNLGWLAIMFGAADPYYPFMQLELPLLAGLWLLANR